MKVLIQALLAFIFVQQWVPILEGQSTGSGAWTTFTCDRKKNAILFTIKIGNCNIIPSGLPCFMDLIDRMVLQGCSSKDADSYVCNISSSYTGDPPCCVSRFIDSRTSNSCESMDTTQSTTEPAASTQSTTLTQGTTEPAVATSTQGTTGLTDISTAATSTVPNLNSTADIPDPPMKDDNDPYIPVYYVFGIIIALIIVVVVVVGVLSIMWYCRKYKLKCVSPSVRDDPGGDNPPNQVENPIVASPMENRGASGAGGIDTNGRRQSSPSQENSQDASQGGSQAPATTDTEQENKLRRRNRPTVEMRQPRQEVTKAEEELRGSTRAVPSKDPSTGYTPESVIQSFSGPCGPTCTTDNFIIQEDMSSPSAPTAAQASDDGNSPYVPTLLKSSSLDNNDLVTAHMSHLECKDDIQEKPSMSSVVQGHMQSLDQDDPEAEALVVQQKVKVGEDTSSAVAHKQRSCFKSGGTDDETRGSVSRKDPLKKHKFPPAHFGTVGVAITCALILATFVCHGRGYTSHPSFAYKYRWFDRGTPWIRALADRLTYPQMFDLHNLGLAAYCGIFPMTLTTLSTLYNQCQRKTADPTLNDQTSLAYNYQWLDRGTWIGAIAYPFIFGSPNLRLAVYCGIVLTTLALVIMATTLISLFGQYQPGPIRAPLAVKYCVSLAAIKSCRWTGIAPHVNIPPHLSLQIGAASAF